MVSVLKWFEMFIVYHIYRLHFDCKISWFHLGMDDDFDDDGFRVPIGGGRNSANSQPLDGTSIEFPWKFLPWFPPNNLLKKRYHLYSTYLIPTNLPQTPRETDVRFHFWDLTLATHGSRLAPRQWMWRWLTLKSALGIVSRRRNNLRMSKKPPFRLFSSRGRLSSSRDFLHWMFLTGVFCCSCLSLLLWLLVVHFVVKVGSRSRTLNRIYHHWKIIDLEHWTGMECPILLGLDGLDMLQALLGTHQCGILPCAAKWLRWFE